MIRDRILFLCPLCGIEGDSCVIVLGCGVLLLGLAAIGLARLLWRCWRGVRLGLVGGWISRIIV